MTVKIEGFYNETAIQGETFDMLAYRLYGEERMSKYIRSYNQNYSDVVMFEGGESLTIPVVSEIESTESLAPWRR